MAGRSWKQDHYGNLKLNVYIGLFSSMIKFKHKSPDIKHTEMLFFLRNIVK